MPAKNKNYQVRLLEQKLKQHNQYKQHNLLQLLKQNLDKKNPTISENKFGTK